MNQFFKSIFTITILLMIISLFGLYVINNELDTTKPWVADFKSILTGTFVGLFFSFLLSIQSIREYLLKSISHFMSDSSYISKLKPEEKEELKNNIIKEIHGEDIVTNKESLFNYLSTLDVFLIKPHKSILNDTYNYSYHDINLDILKIQRIQNYRIHTLNVSKHNTFKFIFKYRSKLSGRLTLENFKSTFFLELIINENKEEIIDHNNKDLSIEYIDNSEVLVSYVKDIPLVNEFTKISAIHERLEEIDDSIGIFNSDATYGLNYHINLPENITIQNIYHSNTLDLTNKQVDKTVNKNSMILNINGWQLPGLIFVVTFKKDI